MREEPSDPRLWLLLLGFLLFCVVVGVLFGLVAYRLVQELFRAFAA